MSNIERKGVDVADFWHSVVVYQDDSLLVVNKPAGLLSVPGKTADLADCLIARLVRHDSRVLLVHRLDRDTSGLLVFALSKDAQRKLSMQFELKQARKRYIALVYGQVDAPVGQRLTIDVPVRYEPTTPPLHVTDSQHAKAAITEYEVMEVGGNSTRIALYPITGRSHQLRVHCQHIAHPIVGDTLYANNKLGSTSNETRLCLHAEQLSITHPVTGEEVGFEAPAPF